MVEYIHSPNPYVEAGISIDFPMATIRVMLLCFNFGTLELHTVFNELVIVFFLKFSRLVFVPQERDGVPVPCFLKEFLIPLVRAGQQLQVLVKLLELCAFVAPNNHTYESFLPCWSGFSSNCPSSASPLTFSKGNIEAMVLSRDCYYKRMQKKLEDILTELEFRFQQVVCFDSLVSSDGNCAFSSKMQLQVSLFGICFLLIYLFSYL